MCRERIRALWSGQGLKMSKFIFDKAVFTYSISNQRSSLFSGCMTLGQGDLLIQCTSRTQVLHTCGQGREAAVIGYCVDAHEQLRREAIPDALCACDTLDAAWAFCNRLAGKYIIYYADGHKAYLWGDATCSIPLNYGRIGEHVCISPFDQMTADSIGAQPDERLVRLRRSADASQAMPFDWTPYREVKCLLPNQVLDVCAMRSIRMPHKTAEGTEALDDIVQKTLLLSNAITKAYAEGYDLICPLTSGYDSRAVLAIARQSIPDIPCFTVKFDGMDENAADLAIPEEICRALGLPYQKVASFAPPDALTEQISRHAGLFNAKDRIAEGIVYCSANHEKARLHGDIVGQIGKSSVMNSVPDALVGPRFLQCKIHNTDALAREAMRAHIQEIRQAGNGGDLCDLFAWESRCGRWAGQEEALYALCGMNSLSIFNCREMILLWLQIPRKLRKQSLFHKSLIAACDAQLLQYPFNPGSGLNAIKAYWPVFYAATYAKQLLLCARDQRRQSD